MAILFANNAFGVLATSITSSSTSLTLQSGQGARFPAPSGGDVFFMTLVDASNQLEIVKCTARSGDTFTIQREQEGTVARAYTAGDRVELRLTAAGLSDFLQNTQYDATAVKLTGNQTIGGAKTFSSNPISTASQSAAGNSLARRDFVTGLDGQNVKLTGNQTIAGVKNFTTNAQLDGSQVYARSNILGTVSQSGGVPTGAIIQRGSNANGEFVKYADGTQICLLSSTVTFASSTILRTSDLSQPASFAATPNTTFSPQTTVTNVDNKPCLQAIEANANTYVRVALRAAGAYVSGESMPVRIQSIGRWY